MAESLHLSSRHREEIEALLHKHLPGVEVWAYGSRVNGQGHEGSDLDLVLRGPQLAEIDTSRLADFIEALQDSTIPFLVKARDWAHLPKSFHSEIEREHVVLAAAAQDGRSEGGLRGFIRPAPPTLRDSDLNSEWSVDSVGDFFDLVTGYAFKSPDFCDDGIPVIKIKNVKAGHFSKRQFSYVSPDFLDTRSEKIALADDLLISMSGNRHDGSPETWVGKVAFFREEDTYLINQRVGALRLKRNAGLDPRFASFSLSSHPYQELFISIATSSGGQANLSPKQILGASVRYPEIGEQRAIGHILGTLDDKIELNRRMNETLEAMARALFKSWFVDFDPVRAKMEGRDIGLPKDIADLFPDRLVDSELGEIPEGWKVVPLSEIMNFKEGPGIRHWQYTNSAEGTRFINIRCIQDGDLLLSTSNRITTEEADGKYAHFHLKEGDIVVSSSGTLGRSAVVRKAHLPLLLNTSVIRFRPVGGATSFSYLHGYLNSSIFLDELKSLATGSVQKNVGPTHLKKMRVLFPPYNCIERYEEIAGPFLQKVNIKRTDNTALAGLRDTLLPRLVSGEVRVNVSGQRIEEAM